MKLGIRSSTYRAVFLLVLADYRKHAGNGHGIRRARPRAAVSSEAIRAESCKDRARARY